MNKLNNANAVNGTSFHNVTIVATPQELFDILGEPECDDNGGGDKVNFEWWLETADGKAVTLYDWKEYRRLSMYEEIEWHIGGHSFIDTTDAKDELQYLLDNCRIYREV